MMDKYKDRLLTDNFLRHSNAQSWKGLEKGIRSKIIYNAQKRGLINPTHAYLLEWLFQSSLTLAEEAKVNELIENIKKQLFDTLPAENQKDIDIEIPQIPRLDPLPSDIHPPSRILNPQEILERFQALGVNIRKVIRTWTNFYSHAGYAKSLNKSLYDFEFPDITNDMMEAFEHGFREGIVDTLIIDDNRLPEGNTLKRFQPSTSRISRKKYNTTRQLSRPFLMDFLDESIVSFAHRPEKEILEEEKNIIEEEYLLGEIEVQPIRIIATHTGLYSTHKIKKYSFEETANLLNDPYITLMSLGTWTRLLHYLKTSNPSLYRQFLTNLSKLQNKGYRSDPEILLNSFTEDGHFVTAKGHLANKEYLVKASTNTTPFQLDQHTTPIITIQSDYPPIDDDTLDSTYEEIAERDIPF